MTGNRMVVHGVTGKRIVGCRMEPGPDGKMGVVIDMEDERPKLLTPKARAQATMAGCFLEPLQSAAEAVAMAAVVDDRADILKKAAARFVTGGSMARGSDPLGQRYIHYDDLLDLLKS